MDDFLVCASTTADVKVIIAQFQVKLLLNDLGPVNIILGMEVERDMQAGTLTIT